MSKYVLFKSILFWIVLDLDFCKLIYLFNCMFFIFSIFEGCSKGRKGGHGRIWKSCDVISNTSILQFNGSLGTLSKEHITLTWTSTLQPQVLMWSVLGRMKLTAALNEISLCVVLMLRLKINTLHFGKQIWLGKLLKYLKSGLLKLLPRGTLRRKLYAVRGRNCISVLMPVSAVCCCHLLPPGCRCWCHSAWWHGSVVGISADGLWQEWAKRGKRKKATLKKCERFLEILKYSDDLSMSLFDN